MCNYILFIIIYICGLEGLADLEAKQKQNKNKTKEGTIMPAQILEKLQALKSDLEFEEAVLTGEFWASCLAPLD